MQSLIALIIVCMYFDSKNDDHGEQPQCVETFLKSRDVYSGVDCCYTA